MEAGLFILKRGDDCGETEVEAVVAAVVLILELGIDEEVEGAIRIGCDVC